MASTRWTRSLVLTTGAALGASAALVAPFLAACSCGTTPPSIQSCDMPLADFSGVESVEIVGARAVAGFQGGQHFQFQIHATGTNLGTCIAQSTVLSGGGSTLASSSTPVTADVDDATSITSTPIYLFPSGLGSGRVGHLHVEAFGRALDLDVSLDPFGGPLDAAVVPDADLDAARPDAAPEPDAPDDAPVVPYTISLHVVDQTGAAVEGATVRVDATASGRSLTAMSAVDGAVTTDSFAWPDETTIDITVSGSGFTPMTVIGLAHGNEPRLDPFVVTRAAPPVTVRGMLTLVDAMSRVQIGTDARESTIWNDVGTSYAVDVAAGGGFRLFAYEHTQVDAGRDFTRTLLGATLLESPALTADGTLDVVLGDPSAATRVAGSVMMPSGAGFAGADLDVAIEDVGTGGRGQALLTHVAYATDGTRADFELTYLPRMGAAMPYALYTARGAQRSLVRLDDYPLDGEQPVVWLDAPTTSASGATISPGDVVSFGGFDAVLRIVLSDTQPRWIWLIAHSADVTVPLPSVDTTGWTFPLTAEPEACEPIAAGVTATCRRATTGEPFSFAR